VGSRSQTMCVKGEPRLSFTATEISLYTDLVQALVRPAGVGSKGSCGLFGSTVRNDRTCQTLNRMREFLYWVDGRLFLATRSLSSVFDTPVKGEVPRRYLVTQSGLMNSDGDGCRYVTAGR